MRELQIKQGFSGYPDGKRRVDYAPNQTFDVPSDVMSEQYAELLVQKGHAEFINAQSARVARTEPAPTAQPAQPAPSEPKKKRG